MNKENLRPITVYLPEEEIQALEEEAKEEGRSGASPQIRYILKKRRDKEGHLWTPADA